jgi:hypothetical protein
VQYESRWFPEKSTHQEYQYSEWYPYDTGVFIRPCPVPVIPTKSVATSAGAVITIDCGYDPINDNVRTRPPVVSDIHISNVNVGNVDTGAGQFSAIRLSLFLGPVPSDYNGPTSPAPKIVPVKNVTYF